MTFREKAQMEHPRLVSCDHLGGCRGCPGSYGYEPRDYCYALVNNLPVGEVVCTKCWDREIPEEKESCMNNKNFNRNDILPGQAVKFRNGSFRFVCKVGKGTLILLNPNNHCWTYLSAWDAVTLRYDGPDYKGQFGNENPLDIMVVYGLPNKTDDYGYTLSYKHVSDRPVVWQRLTTKKMTVEEIEKVLGYSVEIVSEKGE